MTSRSVRSSGRNRNSGSGSDDVHPLVGNYRLLKTIGKGNFAKVKLARHILTGSEVRSQECVSCVTQWATVVFQTQTCFSAFMFPFGIF